MTSRCEAVISQRTAGSWLTASPEARQISGNKHTKQASMKCCGSTVAEFSVRWQSYSFRCSAPRGASVDWCCRLVFQRYVFTRIPQTKCMLCVCICIWQQSTTCVNVAVSISTRLSSSPGGQLNSHQNRKKKGIALVVLRGTLFTAQSGKCDFFFFFLWFFVHLLLRFHHPQVHLPACLLSSITHHLPTFASYWDTSRLFSNQCFTRRSNRLGGSALLHVQKLTDWFLLLWLTGGGVRVNPSYAGMRATSDDQFSVLPHVRWTQCSKVEHGGNLC